MENDISDVQHKKTSQENIETQLNSIPSEQVAVLEKSGLKDDEEEEEEEEEDDEEGDLEEEDIDLLEKELLEAEEGEGGDDMSEDEENESENIGSVVDSADPEKKRKKRKNIRKMLNEDELAEETRLEQEREVERIRRLRELHEKSAAEERAKREEKRKHRSSEGSKQVILLVDDDSESEQSDKPKKPKKEPCVITLSSDEESENESEKPLTGYDDTTGFVGGMHTDDSKNVADSQGRVLVNVNHPPDEMDIFLTPKLAQTIKCHQIGGVRFLYDNIIESVSRFKSSPGFGCILAHTMGLGKTLQSISFVDCCLRNTPTQTVLIVVPVNVLQNWVNEFDMWVPVSLPDDLASSRSYPVYVINDSLKTFEARATLIKKWHETGGVMILGYEMFRLLALTEPSYAVSRKLCRKRRKRGAPVKEVCDIDEEEFYMDLLTATQRSLLNPGPDIIVCDEGHRIKNAHATISKALKKIKSRRRIVLTGYPLQNNLEEYWCMVDFVRPNFLGTKNEFNNMFVRPIENGQCVDSTFKDTQLMKFRSHVLHSLLEGFVQRRDQSILQHSLLSKTEYVLCVKMTPVQRQLLKRFALEMEYEGGVNPIYAFTVLTKIWNHPDVLQEVVSSSKMDDLDVELPKQHTGKLSLDWALEELAGLEKGVVEDGAKMVLLLELIEESVAIGDKVVVFSQSLLTLSLVEKFLQQRYVPEGAVNAKKDIRSFFHPAADGEKPSSPEYPPAQHRVKWTKNKHYFRLDGSTNSQDREKLIKQFNQKGESALVFLISTRAGSLGVNLIGSNRVIIMDVSWNPCHDAQAVCRIYRYGQTKPSYVYRFVAENTLERTIYNKQITKQGMSSRVIDEQNVEKQFTSSEIVSSAENLEMLPAAQPDDKEADWSHMVPEISDSVLRTVLERHNDLLTAAPFTHESLLIENKNERLTQEEKMLAKKSYQFEKQMNKGFGGYSNTYSKPVNRVTPMCKAAPRPGPGAQALPPIDTSASGTAHWATNKAPTNTGVPLEEFAEKYNAQNWSPLIKPLSPLQPTEETTQRSFSLRVDQQTYQARQRQDQQNVPSRPTNNVTKPRSILPAPPVSTHSSQTYTISTPGGGPSPPQPPLKLPLPRLTPHMMHQASVPLVGPPKVRSRKPSKVVSSVRPTVLTQGEDGKMIYKQLQQTPTSAGGGGGGQPSKPASITDALRAIDERTIEPPTVSVQRMIEQNESLRRQVELEGFFPLRSTTTQQQQQASEDDGMSLQHQGECTPSQLEDNPDESKEQSELNTTNESKEEDNLPKKSKKRSTKKSNSQQPAQQQVVYQAIPAQALQSNQGYQLLIQMPGTGMSGPAKVLPATQIINGQQFLQAGNSPMMGSQPIFIQKQNTAPLQIQMPVGNKTVYLVSQPSNMPQQMGPMPHTTTATMPNSLDQYITPEQETSKEQTPDSTPSSCTSTPKQDVVQQTPPPTLLSPVSYVDQQQQPEHHPLQQSQQVLIQQQAGYSQFQPGYQYQHYYNGSQPRMMHQQMYIQPSQIQRVQQKPKIKPKPKSTAKSKSKSKPKEAAAAVSSQMQANILAQQKQRQLTQMHYNPAAYQRPAYHPQYYGMVPHSGYPGALDPRYPGTQQALEPRYPGTGAPVRAEMKPRHYYADYHMYQQQQLAYSQQQYAAAAAATPAAAGYMPDSPDETKKSNKRKSRKKTEDQADNHVNIQIHSPINCPPEKKSKKSNGAAAKKTPAPSPTPAQQTSQPECPYTPRSYPQLQHQQHLYHNMMSMHHRQQQQQQQQQYPQQYRQQQQQYKQFLSRGVPPQQPQQQYWNYPPQHYQQAAAPQQQPRYHYSSEEQRTASPPSGDEMDVNQFLNIPIKNEPAVS